jgi:hypothetical protein
VKFYYATTLDKSYSAVIAGNSPDELVEVLNDQMGDEEEWEITELSDLDVDLENPIILTDGW